MTTFDKAWGVVKTRGFDIRDHAKRSHNEYIPVDGNGVPIALEPMDYFAAIAEAEAWAGDEHSGWDHESDFKPASIVMFEGNIMDEINDYGHWGIDRYRARSYDSPAWATRIANRDGGRRWGQDNPPSDDNFDVMAEILGTDKGDSDAAVDEYERLKGKFDNEGE